MGKVARELIGQRVDIDTCTRCRKKLEEGHRISQALIFDREGRDPMNIRRTGAHLKEEYEFCHIDCKDPYLLKPLTP
jgi:hypothetical protein